MKVAGISRQLICHKFQLQTLISYTRTIEITIISTMKINLKILPVLSLLAQSIATMKMKLKQTLSVLSLLAQSIAI